MRPNPPRRKRPKSAFSLLADKDAERAIDAAVKAAARERVPLALIGGLALRAYGSERLTRDVDFAAPRIPLFAQVGLPLPDGIGMRVWSGAVPVDVLDGGGSGLYADAAKTARRTKWGFRIATPEHLAVMKFEAGRPKDVLDLEWLLREPGLVDRRKLRALASRYLTFPAELQIAEIAEVLRRIRPRKRNDWGAGP